MSRPNRTTNHTVPYLSVHDAENALAFYAEAFGARETVARTSWEGKIGHAQIEIEGATIMLADEFPAYNKSPRTLGGTTVSIHVDVKDVDAFYARAIKAGAKVLQPVKDQPDGRRCKLQDPYGHEWFFSTRPAKPAK